MELALAIIGLVVAIIAALISGFTARSSKRSADAAIASARAAESSAAASEKAVQLDTERFIWEQSARLILSRRHVNGHAGEEFAETIKEFPKSIGLELSNAGQAPAIGLRADALILGEYIAPNHELNQSIKHGESAACYFQLPEIESNPEKFTMVVTFTYQDVRFHELIVTLVIFSRSGAPEYSRFPNNYYGSYYKPVVQSAFLDGSELEGWNTGELEA